MIESDSGGSRVAAVSLLVRRWIVHTRFNRTYGSFFGLKHSSFDNLLLVPRLLLDLFYYAIDRRPVNRSRDASHLSFVKEGSCRLLRRVYGNVIPTGCLQKVDRIFSVWGRLE